MLSMLSIVADPDRTANNTGGRMRALDAHGQHVVFTMVSSAARNAVDSGFCGRLYDLLANVAFDTNRHAVKEYLVRAEETSQCDTEPGSPRGFRNMQMRVVSADPRRTIKPLRLPTAGHCDGAPLAFVEAIPLSCRIVASAKQPLRKAGILLFVSW